MMDDKTRNPCSNETVKKILGNITSDRHSADGQYIPLNYSSSQPAESWNMQNKLGTNHFIGPYNLANNEPQLPYTVDHQFNHQMPFNYLQQQLYNADPFDKHLNNDIHNTNYDMYQNFSSPNVQEVPRISSEYNLFMSSHHDNFLSNHPDPAIIINSPMKSQQATPQLIENLVGNWVPTTTGTYSPFGNMASYPPKLFDNDIDNLSNHMTRQVLDETPVTQQEFIERPPEDVHFQFIRDTKKPRMVAEVKPMRPSYSDVLLKSAPQSAPVKQGKIEVKDTKQKKDTKKSTKTEKQQKSSNILNRSNTTNEIKDIPTEKSSHNKSASEKYSKEGKPIQLNRKWASLDNVTETIDVKVDLNDRKNKKCEENVNRNSTAKANQKKINKNSTSEFVDTDSAGGKNDTLNITKNTIRKVNKPGTKQRNYENFSNNERPPGKRSQRNRKRDTHVPLGFVGVKLRQYMKGWWKIFVRFIFWLFHLISDICSLSIHLSRDMAHNFWSWFLIHWSQFVDTSIIVLKRIRFLTWLWDKIKREKPKEEQSKTFLHSGLQININMPTTGEEAMKRLLACKGKDPYSILGVTPTCTDDDIKRYYKRQAFLVHPDKNQQPGAEEAFKILVHAFDMIGEPERRAAYDRGVAESAQVEQAWSELTELLAQLQQKVEAAANTIRCSACGLRHKRIKVDKPSYAARNCTSCKIHHSAREGDIWAEAKCFGFLWHYYACMEGGVYDITDWAGCQKESLKHLKPDSHHVQYRIALGKQNGGPPRRHSNSPRNERPPDLENLLNSLYGQHENSQSTRRKNKKANK